MQAVDHPLLQGGGGSRTQAAHGVGDALDGVLNGVGEIVQGVDAPGVALAVVMGPHDAVDGRVRRFMLGLAMSILARRCGCVGKFAARMRRKRSRFSCGVRSRQGLGRPGWVRVPRYPAAARG